MRTALEWLLSAAIRAPSGDNLQPWRFIVARRGTEAFDAVPVSQARTWVGVAGTVTTLSAVAQALPEYDADRTHLSRLSLDQVRATTEDLLSMTHEQRAAIGAIHPGRVDVIAGGALVVRVLADQLAKRAGITELLVSEHDILDGIALSVL